MDERDLHLSEADLTVDPEDLLSAGPEVGRLVRALSNAAFRRSVAGLLDHYLARAKAEVFTGRATDLLDVFEEVRQEIGSRGQELCLFIEDLVLLHGIDGHLAQALTIPASKELCRIRAVIAVTSGYLHGLETFAERGVHYTMDVPRARLGPPTLRSFVARYLNAGHVGTDGLAAERSAGGAAVANKCTACQYRPGCHAAFGRSSEGYGFYPFNAAALDRMVKLASPGGFDPRNILREVVSGPLEVAEDELPIKIFPSARFAASLDPNRADLGPEVREQIRKGSATPEAEISLRSFYATHPPAIDDAVRAAAVCLDVALTDVEITDGDGDTRDEETKPPPSRGEIDRWVNGARLSAATALVVRRWVLETVVARFQTGPHGLPTRRLRKGGSDWQIGNATVRLIDVRITDAGGEGALEGAVSIRFDRTDADAILLKGILTAARSGRLDGTDGGRWFFDLETRLAKFESAIVREAGKSPKEDVRAALAVLAVSSLLARQGTESTERPDLAKLLRPARRDGLHPAAASFLDKVMPHRQLALKVLRDNLTQSKGAGAPSVLDVSAVLSDLQIVQKLRSLKRPSTGSDDLVRALNAFDSAQRDAAIGAWRDVRDEITRLHEVLPGDEDLAGALEELDRFVDDAHARGVLPEADSSDRYRDLRQAMLPDAMETYRRLDQLSGDEIGPEDLWEVAIDPCPALRGLRSYATEASRLLAAVGSKLASGGTHVGSGDRKGLHDCFRALADRLDQLEKHG